MASFLFKKTLNIKWGVYMLYMVHLFSSTPLQRTDVDHNSEHQPLPYPPHTSFNQQRIGLITFLSRFHLPFAI